jgi:hypothetical protein
MRPAAVTAGMSWFGPTDGFLLLTSGKKPDKISQSWL